MWCIRGGGPLFHVQLDEGREDKGMDQEVV